MLLNPNKFLILLLLHTESITMLSAGKKRTMKPSPFVIQQRREIIRYETELSPNSKLVPKLLHPPAKSPAWGAHLHKKSFLLISSVRCKFSALTLVSSRRKPLLPTWDHGSDSRGAAGEVKQLDDNSGFVHTLMMEK